ncbi:hypothetical protein [Metarhizobium album]|uniref:hypothetical protein n=1 Tax=Metarhizobium album TaxID=2182425 RepID=UPI000FFF5C62|nr:hypothetical protein [Rhizobium album]
MFGVLDWLKIGAGCVLGALAISIPAYYSGRSDGRDLERTAALQRSMELIRERSKTNVEISKLSDAAICVELGGKWVLDKCE